MMVAGGVAITRKASLVDGGWSTNSNFFFFFLQMRCFGRDGEQINFFFTIVSRCPGPLGKNPIECNTLKQNHCTTERYRAKTLVYCIYVYTRMQWKSLRLYPSNRTGTNFSIWHHKHQIDHTYAHIRVWNVNWTPKRIMRFAIPHRCDQMWICRANFDCMQRPLSTFKWKHIHPGKLHGSNQR